jgi:hypothetical protein
LVSTPEPEVNGQELGGLKGKVGEQTMRSIEKKETWILQEIPEQDCNMTYKPSRT